MSGTQFGQFILGLIVVAAIVAIGVWLLNWLYLRSSKERAFVRTGLGGQKVVMNGGAFVLPRGGATRRSSRATVCGST